MNETKIPLLFAHRGGKTDAPENTLAAFRWVLENKIPAIELDVHRCATGELVVIHDFHTKRICGTDYSVEETPFIVLRSLDAGSSFDARFAGERIPLLEEVIDLLGDRVFYDIEIKTPHFFGDSKLTDDVLKMVGEKGIAHCSMISSFNPFVVRRVRKKGFPLTAVIFAEDDDVPFVFKRGQGWYIARSTHLKPGRQLIESGRMCKGLKKRNLPLMTWTVNDAREALRLKNAGVVGICTNCPLTLRDAGIC